jgi:hypothetical protein
MSQRSSVFRPPSASGTPGTPGTAGRSVMRPSVSRDEAIADADVGGGGHFMYFHKGGKHKYFLVSHAIGHWFIQAIHFSSSTGEIKAKGAPFRFPFAAGYLETKHDFKKYFMAYKKANNRLLLDAFVVGVIARLQELGAEAVHPRDGGDVAAHVALATYGMQHELRTLLKDKAKKHQKCMHGKYGMWEHLACRKRKHGKMSGEGHERRSSRSGASGSASSSSSSRSEGGESATM